MSNATATSLQNPFVGLRAFEEDEDYLFFGRRNQISELLKILNESRFLAVIGSSGSGKSSLVKSGLLPAIYGGFMTVGSNWRAVTMRPGEDPIGYLTKALANDGVLYNGAKDSDVPYELIIEGSLRRSENGLVQVYRDAHLPPKENLLIVVDQFEELFRFSRYEKEARLGRSDAIHFIQILLAAAQQKDCPIYVLLTMRADFLGDCAEFRGLPEAINEGQYLVPRMRRDEIREAITGPVAVSGATISQRLVTRLLNDLNNDTDQLPILQHALMRTWDAWYQRRQPDTPIDFDDYERIGTMTEALSLHADEAYAELSKEGEQRTCELMFKALTDKAADVRGIRRPRSIADLCVLANASGSRVEQVVEVFRRPGRTFLMPPPSVPLTQHTIIDISHESLMRVWDRLVKWSEEEARSGDIYLRLANSAQLHQQGQRGLLKNPELEIAQRWKEQNNPSVKWAEGYRADFDGAMAYLEESRKEDLAEKEAIRKRTRNRRRLLVGFLVFLLGVAIVLGMLYAKSTKAEALANEAKQNARDSSLAAQRARDTAILARNEATLSSLAAQIAKENALRSAVAEKDAALAARIAQQQAMISAVAEKNAARAARNAEQQAIIKSNQILALNKKALVSISREYARLIREGPSEENRNENEFYGRNYFLIYTKHFNNLEDSIFNAKDTLISGDDRQAYRNLKDRLYYNNDLYRRLYEEYRLQDRTREIISQDGKAAPDAPTRAALRDGPDPVFRKDPTTSLQNIIAVGNATQPALYTLPRRGQEFVAYAVDPKERRVFCSTTDNMILVFNDQLKTIDSISMGAKVTALDFFTNENRSIIYFGTASGYIGYIYYDAYKKNQPVFENKLESRVSTVRLFQRCATGNATQRSNDYYLLATGRTNNPRVYKLDNRSLKPDRFLLGNELPFNWRKEGEIESAHYDCNTSRVQLHTSTGATFLWNPFSDDLLNKLENVSLDPELVKHLKRY